MTNKVERELREQRIMLEVLLERVAKIEAMLRTSSVGAQSAETYDTMLTQIRQQIREQVTGGQPLDDGF